MKKLKNIVISILICLMLVPCLITSPVASASAQDLDVTIDYRGNIQTAIEEIISSTDRHERFACSKEEYNSAIYIQEKLLEFGLTAVNNQSTKNGIQTFDVQTDSGVLSSQNVIFKKTGTDSNKKVIIATHYDTDYVYKVDDAGETIKAGSEGVSESGASVATLLVLAQALSYETFDFDIEFVFFGANNHNLAGSAYYTSFISSEDAKNIMLMINIDNVVSDGMIYLYNGEFKNQTDNYVFSTFSKNFNARNMSDYSIVSDTTSSSVTGLEYTNFALESDNAHFIRVGVKTLSPVSIQESQVNALGIVTYEPLVSIQNDTIDEVNKITSGKYLNNLSLIVNGCMNLLKDSAFKTTMSESSSSTLYEFLGNQKLMVFIAFVLLIVIGFVYSIIKYYLEKQALKARSDIQLDKVIATISPSDLEDMDALMNRLEKQFEENAKQVEEKRKANSPESKSQTSDHKNESGESQEKSDAKTDDNNSN